MVKAPVDRATYEYEYAMEVVVRPFTMEILVLRDGVDDRSLAEGISGGSGSATSLMAEPVISICSVNCSPVKILFSDTVDCTVKSWANPLKGFSAQEIIIRKKRN